MKLFSLYLLDVLQYNNIVNQTTNLVQIVDFFLAHLKTAGDYASLFLGLVYNYIYMY